jgi:hypothetical protein
MTFVQLATLEADKIQYYETAANLGDTGMILAQSLEGTS